MVKNLSKEEYNALQKEMERLKSVKYVNYQQALKDVGISYLASVAHSAKLEHSLKYQGVATLGVYLASSDLSGYNVCPSSDMCKENCLVGSGRAKANALAGKQNFMSCRIKKNKIILC